MNLVADITYIFALLNLYFQIKNRTQSCIVSIYLIIILRVFVFSVEERIKS